MEKHWIYLPNYTDIGECMYIDFIVIYLFLASNILVREKGVSSLFFCPLVCHFSRASGILPSSCHFNLKINHVNTAIHFDVKYTVDSFLYVRYQYWEITCIYVNQVFKCSAKYTKFYRF